MKISKELDYPFSASRGNIGLTKEQRSESKIIAYMHEIDIQPYLILSHFIIVILHKIVFCTNGRQDLLLAKIL